jgi:hypothetical protein
MQTTSNSTSPLRATLKMAAGALLLGLTLHPAKPASPVVDPATRSTADATRADQEYFLLTAEIVHSEPIPGVDGATRATLSNGSSTEHALVRTIDAYQYRWATIRDSYRYNVAAYRLGKMLGLAAVPVTVQREVDGRMASVTLWPDKNSALDEGADLVAFRQLVYAPINDRSNLPATLSSADYTHAFALCDELPDPSDLSPLSPDFRYRLQELNRHELSNQLGSLLSKKEIEFLWQRRHELLEHSGHVVSRLPAANSNPAANQDVASQTDLG